MTEYTLPGVYVQETSSRSKLIVGVNTHTTAFIGPTLQGPDASVESSPKLLTSFAEFEQVYGGLDDLPADACQPSATNYVAYAARAFFDEGGERLYIFRISSSSSLASYQQALAAIELLQDISIVAMPGNTTPEVAHALIAYAERLDTQCFVVLDSLLGLTPAEVLEYRGQFDSMYAAIYYPWVVVSNGEGEALLLPPSGFICGIYARTDIQRGVHKAPANEVLRGALNFERDVTHNEQEKLNPEGINCLRFFQGRGYRVWGGRTLSSDPEWKYVNVRRFFNYLQVSIKRGTQWAELVPNSEILWTNIQQTISDFLFNEWRKGSLVGSKLEEAFFVKCDRSTMTQHDIDNGRVVCLVGVAIVKPAEFMVFRLELHTV